MVGPVGVPAKRGRDVYRCSGACGPAWQACDHSCESRPVLFARRDVLPVVTTVRAAAVALAPGVSFKTEPILLHFHARSVFGADHDDC